jgi:hypothetical protein
MIINVRRLSSVAITFLSKEASISESSLITDMADVGEKGGPEEVGIAYSSNTSRWLRAMVAMTG